MEKDLIKVVPLDLFEEEKDLKECLKDDRLRLAVYIYMLTELHHRQEIGYSASMCISTPLFMKVVPNLHTKYRLRSLPELWRKRPEDHEFPHGAFWFDHTDFDVRYAILNKIISRLKKKLSITDKNS